MGTVANKQVEDRRLMPPPPVPARRSSMKVLEEDAYVAQLEAIIERDYFPDVPKLQNHLEWMQAVNSGDPLAIRQAQLNIARRRAGLKTPSAGAGQAATPGWTVTPGTAMLRTPAMTPVLAPQEQQAQQRQHADQQQAPLQQQAAALRAPAMSLDEFLSTHTSEDNASFSTIVQESNARKRQKVAHHLNDKNQPLLLEGPQRTDGYGSSGQAPGTLLTWRHAPKNQLYYAAAQREDAALTPEEAAQRARAATKVIQKHGTRMKAAAEEHEAAAAAPAAAAAVGDAEALGPAAAAALAHALEAGRAPQRGGGYGKLATPSLTPLVGASPLMTWGDIESTPVRLDGLDDLEALMVAGAGAGDGGPQFRLTEVRRREQVARDLAQHGSVNALRRHAKSVAGAPVALPSSGQKGSAGKKVPMSPAARKLAALLSPSSRAASATPDAQLRASYSKAPSGSGGRLTTPKAASTAAATPVLTSTKQAASGGPVMRGGSINTDDLLNLTPRAQ